MLLLAFFTAYGVLSLDIALPPVQHTAAFNARTIPTALTVIGLLGGLWLVVMPPSREGVFLRGLRWRHAAAFLVLMSAYGFALRPVGFIAATLVFLATGFMLLGERRPIPICLVASSITVGFWALLHFVLDVYLTPWPDAWAG